MEEIKVEAPIKTEAEIKLEAEKAALEAKLKATEDKAAKEKVEADLKLREEKTKRLLDAKIGKIEEVLKDMVAKGLITADTDIMIAFQREGDSLLDARSKAFKQAISKQKANLLKMDNISLTAFTDSIKTITKQANIDVGSLNLSGLKIDKDASDADWLKNYKGWA